MRHIPVLAREVIEYLAPEERKEGGGPIVVDATVGEGGHAELFLEKFPWIRLYGIDADKSILEKAQQRLSRFKGRFELLHGWFDEILFSEFFKKGKGADIFLFDLGVSMFHFKNSGRGFSFAKDEPLDMRLNDNLEKSAYEIVNSYSQEELARIFREYGEERFAKRIAERIILKREESEIKTSGQLAEIIRLAVPKSGRYGKIHPATRCFQALRIEVNNELKHLNMGLEMAVKVLNPGGKVGVISFHSLEDRIVKQFFKSHGSAYSKTYSKTYSDGEKKPILKEEEFCLEILTKKPLMAGEEERIANPASRSAKFRVCRKK